MYDDADKVFPSSIRAFAFEFERLCDAKGARGQHSCDEPVVQRRLGPNIRAPVSDSEVVSMNDEPNEH